MRKKKLHQSFFAWLHIVGNPTLHNKPCWIDMFVEIMACHKDGIFEEIIAHFNTMKRKMLSEVWVWFPHHLHRHPNCHQWKWKMPPVCQQWAWFEYYREWIQLKCPWTGFSVFPIKRNVIVCSSDWRVARGNRSQSGKQSLIFPSGIDNFLPGFSKGVTKNQRWTGDWSYRRSVLWIKVRYCKWSNLELISLPRKPN